MGIVEEEEKMGISCLPSLSLKKPSNICRFHMRFFHGKKSLLMSKCTYWEKRVCSFVSIFSQTGGLLLISLSPTIGFCQIPRHRSSQLYIRRPILPSITATTAKKKGEGEKSGIYGIGTSFFFFGADATSWVGISKRGSPGR